MDNLKKFETQAQYEAATLSYPNVSWIVSGDTVHYVKEKSTFSGLTVYYNVADISEPTQLFNDGSGGSGSGSGGGGGVLPSAMKIDGAEVEVTNSYQFSTTGEHIVQFSFEENTIPNKCFNENADVTKVEIGGAITSINNEAFYVCYNLTSLTIGSGVTSIGDNAFGYCYRLTSATIGNGVTKIGSRAFIQCYRLTSCTIGTGVTTIGDYAFSGCTNLTSIEIPSGVTSIKEYAFNGCTSLTSITVNATTPPTLGSVVFTNTNDCPIYVPAASVNSYKAATNWRGYASRIQPIT